MKEELMKIISKVLADDLPWLETDLDEFAGRIASAIFSADFVKKDEIRKQLLEKLGEKKKCINCGTTNYDDHAVSCRRKLEQKGFNALHDYITSIINEVLPIEKK